MPPKTRSKSNGDGNGPDCDACFQGDPCVLGVDCDSLVCLGNVCQAPNCEDGVRNGVEHGVDCGPGCQNECPNQFEILERQDVAHMGNDYALLQVRLRSDRASTGDWCREYRELCYSLGAGFHPTGCGPNWANRGGYLVCVEDYGSYVTDDSLSCNPSGRISQIAREAGYADATPQNSFGFHSCSANICGPIMCRGNHCHTGLSYIDLDQERGYTLCRVAPCGNGVLDEGEADVDCGGDCEPCADGLRCEEDAGCANGRCVEGLCAPAACDDGIHNGDEEGVDCGGGCAAVCPTCEDGEHNGEESDVDCGGPCAPCLVGGACNVDEDCDSGVCIGEVCAAPNCGDGVQNGTEEGVDCGGDCEGCPNSFEVLDMGNLQDFMGTDYLVLKVRIRNPVATTGDWCREYQSLCDDFGLHPTGCGLRFRNIGGYSACFDEYGSIAHDDSLGCNPSATISRAATAAGFEGATPQNAFGFHSCSPAGCTRELCRGDHCNSAISYIDLDQEFGFTLCRAPEAP